MTRTLASDWSRWWAECKYRNVQCVVQRSPVIIPVFAAPGVNTRQKIQWKIGPSSKKYLLKKEKLCSLRSSYSLQILKWFFVSGIHFSSIHNHSIWLKNILSYSCYLHLSFLVHVVTAGGGMFRTNVSNYAKFDQSQQPCPDIVTTSRVSAHSRPGVSRMRMRARSVEDESVRVWWWSQSSHRDWAANMTILDPLQPLHHGKSRD